MASQCSRRAILAPLSRTRSTDRRSQEWAYQSECDDQRLQERRLSLLAMQLPFDLSRAYVGYCDGMDVERIIEDIEQLQEMFEAPDIRPLNATDISAANRRHDETLAHSPWFKLWQHYGVCCRVQQ